MNMITYFNELVTKNFNNYLKKYFNNMNYTEKNGNFINYYNFIIASSAFCAKAKPLVCTQKQR